MKTYTLTEKELNEIIEVLGLAYIAVEPITDANRRIEQKVKDLRNKLRTKKLAE